MKKEDIRASMLKKIANSFEEAIREAEERIAEEIEEDDILDFIWEKNFGASMYKDYIDEIINDLKEELLEDIYDDIEIEDILDITGRR